MPPGGPKKRARWSSALRDSSRPWGARTPDYTAELRAQDLASYYGMIGDAVDATRWLEFAFDLSPAGVDTRILGSALFEPVENDPRFSSAVDATSLTALERVVEMRRTIRSPF